MSAPNGARFQTPTLRADYASVHVDCPAKTNLTLHVGNAVRNGAADMPWRPSTAAWVSTTR